MNSISSKIYVESLDNIEMVISQCQKIYQKKNDENLIIDFSRTRYMTPTAAALFARGLRYIVNLRTIAGLKTFVSGHLSDKPAVNYLRFIGFFDFIGIHDVGESVRTSVIRSGRYIPITQFSYLRFQPDPDKPDDLHPADLIEPEAKEISRLFTTDSQPHKSLQYIICEILRNAYEHSRSDKFFVFGQYWKNGRMELVILDDGVGILSTLQKKYPYLSNQEEAILKAMEAGVSGASFEPKLNKYNNSGFGLFVVSELARKHGRILLASKEIAVDIDATSVKKYDIPPAGTTICLSLNNIWNVDYDKEIDWIIERGKEQASQGEYPISPSKRTLSYK